MMKTLTKSSLPIFSVILTSLMLVSSAYAAADPQCRGVTVTVHNNTGSSILLRLEETQGKLEGPAEWNLPNNHQKVWTVPLNNTEASHIGRIKIRASNETKEGYGEYTIGFVKVNEQVLHPCKTSSSNRDSDKLDITDKATTDKVDIYVAKKD